MYLYSSAGCNQSCQISDPRKKRQKQLSSVTSHKTENTCKRLAMRYTETRGPHKGSEPFENEGVRTVLKAIIHTFTASTVFCADVAGWSFVFWFFGLKNIHSHFLRWPLVRRFRTFMMVGRFLHCSVSWLELWTAFRQTMDH